MKLSLAVILVLIFSETSIASTSAVNFKLNLANITQKHTSAPSFLSVITPYVELAEIERNISLKTQLGRSVILKWNIINYTPSEDRYFKKYNAYHLFDITWFNQAMDGEYQKEGKWISFQVNPNWFSPKPRATAFIHGHGDAEILISHTICLNDICLGGGGERRGEYDKKIVKNISHKTYKYRVIDYPITKSVYLRIDNDNLKNKVIEMSGEINLGTSAVTTTKGRRYYPFDTYEFDFIYFAPYSTKLNIEVDDIEDLKLVSPSKYSFELEPSIKKPITIKLNRGNVLRDRLWNITMVLIPLVFWIIGGEKAKLPLRIITYIVVVVSLLFLLPVEKGIPWFNPFNIMIVIIFLLIVYAVEKKLKHNPYKTSECQGATGSL